MSSWNDQDYIINVGPRGTFAKSGHYQTLPEHIDQLFANFRQQPPEKIAIYFHGGLVNEARGLATARKIAPSLREANCAPVCFVWETGVEEVIGSNLERLAQTKLFHKLIKFLTRKLINRLGFDTPFYDGEMSDAAIEAELAQPAPFDSYVGLGKSGNQPSRLDIVVSELEQVEEQLQIELGEEIADDPEFQAAINESKVTVDAKGDYTGTHGALGKLAFILHAVKIAIRVIKRFSIKRDHDLYPTVVEEILREFYLAELGASVWDMMKIKADEMWESNAGRSGLNQYAGRYFLDHLARFKRDFPNTEVNLIGHSAGSIAICNLLKHIESLDDAFEIAHIIFMAPACRVDLFQKELLSRRAMYRDLRIFTMSDARECKDMMVPYFYTHSLLYCISGILEDRGSAFDAHILGLERHISFKYPYNIPVLFQAHTYLYETGGNRLSLAITEDGTAPGMGTRAIAHSEFDDDPLTIASIKHILSS